MIELTDTEYTIFGDLGKFKINDDLFYQELKSNSESKIIKKISKNKEIK